jgi:hypothetical protein
MFIVIEKRLSSTYLDEIAWPLLGGHRGESRISVDPGIATVAPKR